DWANPQVRPHMQLYPVFTSKICETCHTAKVVQGIKPELQVPMWADGHTHYLLGELSQLSNRQLVIPVRWFKLTDNGPVYSEEIPVTHDSIAQVNLVHADRSLVRFVTTSLKHNWFSLCDNGLVSTLQVSTEITQGRQMHTCYIKAWGDDVSGNRSKQYNEHRNIYFAHANLPQKKLSQKFFVRFCSMFPHASIGEQFDTLMVDNVTNKWHTAYDCMTSEDIVFRILPVFLSADNPQQSELCSHVGLKGNYWCRVCHLGGTQQETETDQIYQQHFEPGVPRTSEGTKLAVTQQIKVAALGVQEQVTVLQRQTGVKDKLAEFWIQALITKARHLQQICIYNKDIRDHRLQTKGNKNRAGHHYNSLFDVKTLDVHQDTPVELLHTYLLGQDKYIWHLTNIAWTPAPCQVFAVRLEASSIDGLTIPPIRASYMIQYRNSLIGKHFKTLQQLAVFRLDTALVPPLVQDLWKATDKLRALLEWDEIDKMNLYLADLEILIANVLDIWTLIDPKQIFIKAKLHILLHIVENVRQHGPAILFATEIFECFNAIFHMSSVLSNHLAPSRDIAWSCADLERFKHIVSRGSWVSNKQDHVAAGSNVKEFFADPHLQRQLGYAPQERLEPGAAKCPRKNQCASLIQRDTCMMGSIMNIGHDSTWFRCSTVVTQKQDVCQIGSWVFVNHNVRFSWIFTIISQVVEILMDANQGHCVKQNLVVIDKFLLLNSKHPHFNMPEIIRPPTPRMHTILAMELLFIVNVQHNYFDSGCHASGQQFCVQERLKTTTEESYIEHTNTNKYILNLHALHNAIIIRQTLPHHLTAPTMYLKN
ncbi:hypothetical protein SERLA73DRAFT_48037, partial [Serpula lacrymans var. lacrymans S7.3]